MKPDMKQRIAERQAEMNAVCTAMNQCSENIRVNRIRQRELAKRYNNLIGFVGFLAE